MRPIHPACLALTMATALTPLAATAQENMIREISGTLTYLQRIALAPDTIVTVQALGLRDVRLGEVTFATDGAQVPLPFALTVPDGAILRLIATVGAEGGPQWSAGPVTVAATTTATGEIMLNPGGLPFAMICGDVPITARLDGTGAEVMTPRGDLRLGATEAASGARFEAEGDPSTWFWSQGDVATLALFGEELPECVMRPETYTARGNEPFWTFAVEGADLYFSTLDGLEASGPLPEAVWRDGAVEWDVAYAGLRLRMAEGLCRDTMTGMPHPETVQLITAEAELTGCGGDPVTLLTGGDWVIEEIAGAGMVADLTAGLPDAAPLTMAFRDGGSVGGRGGCNSYSAGFTLTGEGLSIGPAAATMMACEDPLMGLEQALFMALPAVTRFDIDASGALVLYGPEEMPLVVARR